MESNFLEEDKECFHVITWESLQNELAPLQRKGKISDLHHRKDVEGKTGCFIVCFNITDKFEPADLFNIIDDYFPKEDENKKKWFSW